MSKCPTCQNLVNQSKWKVHERECFLKRFRLRRAALEYSEQRRGHTSTQARPTENMFDTRSPGSGIKKSKSF